jgi:excisionase family DNA binding protein
MSMELLDRAAPNQPLQPLAYPIEQVPAVSGVPRTKVFEAIRRGELMARKIGRSTLIEHAELQRFLSSLPIRGRRPD